MTESNKVNAMCWNCEGIMAGMPYLLKCLDTYDIDICGLSEHWVREYQLSFFNSFNHSGYKCFVKPVYEVDPFRYKCSIRGGVCLLYKSLLNVQEIIIDSPRIVGLELQSASGEYSYWFSVYMPASSRPFEIFQEH
ncbi:hypothetical protein CI610_02945 [invertebrate metagenome]|uniref:Endonuclease/exonuclease/phosphatase domain-containing protein n=1 Tax=invertebrate metagenome TaxID=1711999 RepID=A0A2H9T4H9_9ZZZZ